MVKLNGVLQFCKFRGYETLNKVMLYSSLPLCENGSVIWTNREG